MKNKHLWKTSIAASLLLLLGTGTVAEAQTSKSIDSSSTKSLTKLEVSSNTEAKSILKSLPQSLDITKNYAQYEVVNTEKDDLNYTHYTLKPKVSSAYATDQEVKIHVDENDRVVFVNGDLNGKKASVTNSKKLQ